MDQAIKFYPAVASRAKTLRSEQIDQFNEQGFISPLDALTPDEAKSARLYFDELLDKMRDMNDRRNAYAIMGYHTRCKGIWQLARHPVLLNYVEDLLGPNFVCWTSHYFCKLPFDQKRVPWHQDATYWPVRPTKTVTVWLAIDDVSLDNAPMRFLPRSHDRGKIEWQPAQDDAVLTQEIIDVSSFDQPYDNVMKAGQISLHTSSLVHGSEANNSNKRRCGLTLRYIPSDCGALAKAERVLLGSILGRGEPNAWKDNPCPPGDDLTPIHNAYID